MPDKLLTVIGSGIKSISHLSVEAKAHIEQSTRLLYLVNEPVLAKWVIQTNPNSESMESIYFRHKNRKDCYKAITEHILLTLEKQKNVCVLLYGHPTVFAQPALDAVKQAKKLNYGVQILPAISAEDCLFADLAIDPATHGCQSLEATDFLLRKYPVHPNSHLILWQIGLIGIFNHSRNHNTKPSLKLLRDHLMTVYPKSHAVFIYEASKYPTLKANIENLPLQNLMDSKVSSISTLYVPPLGKDNYDKKMIEKLGIEDIGLHQF